MPEPDAIYALLRRMMAIYPEFKPSNPAETFQAYAELLEEVDPVAFERAVERWMRDQKWFPRPSELLAVARSEFETMGRRSSDAGNAAFAQLASRRIALEETFYHRGVLDPDEWEHLAVDFDAAGRVESALAVRNKYTRLTTLEPARV